ncbi:hypothetical protein PPERSA_01887 [Pseudocohnilembus persalinus]|uniref:Dipeptidyl peptidase 1 n=1 Tax=Pseudocohnilembus persalinus TaxID=266149 RepID=A0A0V0R460_PSEPJ|nr:hypothetical protein PPERSA_01887 [Pseudocohnilembus persalinus]|eukprot:KRX09000.1 hypothetical protein PPERSA_01887 [Pseudocohnilembus persalinus]
MNKKLFIILIIFSLFIGQSKQDIPVHCLQKQVLGIWDIDVTDSEEYSIQNFVRCGHQSPSVAGDSDDYEFIKLFTYQLELKRDNSAVLYIDGEIYQGTFTMVFDEGFDARFEDFDIFIENKYQNIARNKYQSICSQTMIGWINYKQEEKIGCIKGQLKGADHKPTESLNIDQIVTPSDFNLLEKYQDEQLSQLEQQNNKPLLVQQKKQGGNLKNNRMHNFLQIEQKEQKQNEQQANNKKIHEQNVRKLNAMQTTWKAGISPEFENLSLVEIRKRVGIDQYNKGSFAEQKKELKGLNLIETSRYANLVYTLPTEFSWEEYLDETPQQGTCGSCYAIATTSMITSRIKIKFQDKDFKASTDFALECNSYSQGCNGGFGYLVSKFFNEYGIIDEKDYQTNEGSCGKIEGKVKYKVASYDYIGGFYGNSTEYLIMKEIMENGPVVLSLKVSGDLNYYKEGVYQSFGDFNIFQPKKKENSDNEDEIWKPLNHSVLCYGWGEENGNKYWLIQNSWGAEWGDNGNFKILRGQNECNIENMADFAEVVLI